MLNRKFQFIAEKSGYSSEGYDHEYKVKAICQVE